MSEFEDRIDQSRSERKKRQRRIKKQTYTRGSSRFWRYSLVGGLLFAATAIGIPVCNAIRSTSEFSTASTEDAYREYPEIADQPITESYKIQTPTRRISAYNFTEAKLDPKAAKAIYSYYEKPDVIPNLTIILNGRTVSYTSSPRGKDNSYDLFVTLTDHPKPNLEDTINPIGRIPDAFTIIDPRAKKVITYLQLHQESLDRLNTNRITTSSRDGNDNFFIEACQSSVEVKNSDARATTLGQELLCNSHGIMFSYKQKGLAYDQYKQYVSDFNDPKIPGIKLPLIPESQFNGIPQTGKPLSR